MKTRTWSRGVNALTPAKQADTQQDCIAWAAKAVQAISKNVQHAAACCSFMVSFSFISLFALLGKHGVNKVNTSLADIIL